MPKLNFMMEGDCSTCVYAQPYVGDEDTLLLKCRRYPPQIFLDEENEVAQGWPDANDRCGEFKEAD